MFGAQTDVHRHALARRGHARRSYVLARGDAADVRAPRALRPGRARRRGPARAARVPRSSAGATEESWSRPSASTGSPAVARGLVRRRSGPHAASRRAELAERACSTSRRSTRVWRAAGLPAIDPDAPRALRRRPRRRSPPSSPARPCSARTRCCSSRGWSAPRWRRIADAAMAIFGLTVGASLAESGNASELESRRWPRTASGMLVERGPAGRSRRCSFTTSRPRSTATSAMGAGAAGRGARGRIPRPRRIHELMGPPPGRGWIGDLGVRASGRGGDRRRGAGAS